MRKEALVKMGSATSTSLSIEQLRQLANDADGTLRHLEAVLTSLAASDEELVNWASEALENCGTPATSALTTLQKLLVDSCDNVAVWACKLTARMAQDAAAAQPQLIQALQSQNTTLLREEAARALGNIGPLSAAATHMLEQAAKDGSPRLKRLATAALGR